MKSSFYATVHVADCLTRETFHPARILVFIGALFSISLSAQPTVGNITTTAAPLSGQAVFDAAGNAYYINGLELVTPGAVQTQSGGVGYFGGCGVVLNHPVPCPDAYVGKVDTSGKLVFGTLLGGPTGDRTTNLTVDSSGAIFITGTTGGAFPTTSNAAIPTSTTAKAFAAKISADGSRLIYSTYLPDTAAFTTSIAIDAQGNAYIAGKSGAGHAFVMKLNADGSSFGYTSILAGTNQDWATAILADASGYVIVTGQTNSPDFPVSSRALQSRLAGAQNAFVSKLDGSGRVTFSTYLGGSGSDAPAILKTDSAGNIYVAGQTTSLDFPTTPGSFQPNPLVPLWNNMSPGGFVARLDPDGSALAYSSYVMSTDSQGAVVSLAVSPSGEAYVAGIAGAGFPVTPSAPRICFQGPMDVFVAHLDPHGALLDATYAGAGDIAQALALAPDGSILLLNNGLSRIRFGGAGWTAPPCLSPNALNAATLHGDPATVAPGELITLTGFGIGPDAGATYQPDADGQVPRELARVQVLFDGHPAPVLYAQSRQINAVAPMTLSSGTQTNISVTSNGVVIGSFKASVIFGDAGLFRLQPGISSQAAALNQDGTVNGPSNPALRGSVVSLWGTGFGLTDPSCETGRLNPPGTSRLAPGFSAKIFDGHFNPVLYAGNAPGLLCGIVQINMIVPAYADPGLYLFYPIVQRDSNGESGPSAQPVTIFVK
jgi:uncharacterized protein (TIGR03437 family)